MRTMRYISKIFILTALVASTLTACIRDEVYMPSQIVEGMPTQMGIRFEVKNDIDVTRAAQDIRYEHQVQNVYVFIFSNGNRVPLKNNNGEDISFYDSTAGNAYPDIQNWYNKSSESDSNASTGEILFNAISGSNLQIVLVANIGTSNSVTSDTDSDGTQGGGIVGEQTDALSKYLAIFNDYSKIATYSDLQEFTVKLQSRDIFRLGSFLMTGEKTGVTLHASEEGVLLPENIITVPLYRADSKITFNVKAESKASNITNMQFIPGKWRVINIPTVTYVIPRLLEYSSPITEDMDGAGTNFYSMSEQEANVFEGAMLQGSTAIENSATFTFYMYENLRKNKLSATSYAMREEQEKEEMEPGVNYVPGQDYVNGAWSYAPDYGTYVELTGELSYTLDDDEFVLADVRYYIHLGHESDVDFDSYATLRNHHYTYNVTINSVNDLIVEVDSNKAGGDTENRPGAEGDVVMSAQKVINVDGHYDRALITLTPQEAQEIYFANKTPWEQGLDTNGFLETGNTTIKDYKWVKFLINKDYNIADTQFAPYPGDQCYDGGTSEYGTAAHSGAYNANVILRDIRQLSSYLHDNPPTGNIAITVFIDEYLYFYDPTMDSMTDYSAVKYKGVQDADAAGLLLWKKSVNQQDRMMHIVKAGDMNYSADGETSLSRSVVTIKQRPILTFYNVSADDLVSAWGTETINETPTMAVSGTSGGNSWNPSFTATRKLPSGYANTNNSDFTRGRLLQSTAYTGSGTVSWSNILSQTEQYGFANNNYKDPTYACALRNRDFNGNGTLDANEAQWYLVSINQLYDLWVGEPCMPDYAKLYYNQPGGYDGTYNHTEVGGTVNGRQYITTTPYSSSASSVGNLNVFWSEQYGATSSYAQARGWNNMPRVNNTPVVSVRCIRHLGMAYGDTNMPMQYYSVTTDESGDSNIDLEFMNPTALRKTAVTDNASVIPYSNLGETEINNSAFAGFFVKPGYYGFSGTSATATSQSSVTTKWYHVYRGEYDDADGYTNKVCPTGYRPPRQREMLIMIRALANSSWTYRVDGNGYYNNAGYMMMNGQDCSWNGSYFGTFFYYPTDGDTGGIHRNVTSRMNNQTGADCAVRCVKDNPNAKQATGGEWGEGDM